MENKHLKGVEEALTRQTRENKKTGGPSDALKRLVKRPDAPGWRLAALHNSMSVAKCDKCSATATVSSRVNGELEYQLCSKCYLKRNVQSKKIR